MKLNKKIILSSFLGGFAVVSVGWLISSADAFQGDYTQKGPNCDSERHNQMEQILENGDYEAWQDLMNGRGRVSQVIDENNFSQFAEAYQLAKEGKYEEAAQIREKLGLRFGNGEPVREGFRGKDKEFQGQGLKQGYRWQK